jgi:hypothetical protein
MTQRVTKPGNQHHLMAMEQLEWRMYCAPRFAMGSAAERAAHRQLQEATNAAWHAMYDAARRRGVPLDFTAIGLRLLTLRSLAGSCTYCVELLSLDAIGYTWATPPERLPSACWREANLVICCASCASAKGSLSSSEWLDVMAALRAAEPVAARAARAALGLGRIQLAKLSGRERYSPTAGARG